MQVVVGSHALLANGGIIAAAGTALAAQAARKHAVPLVVLVGLHQLSPVFPDNPLVTLNEFNSPVLSWSGVPDVSCAITLSVSDIWLPGPIRLGGTPCFCTGCCAE